MPARTTTQSINRDWFAGCVNAQEVKARYRQLAQEHHPDHGGTHEVMVAINKAYDARMKSVLPSSVRQSASSSPSRPAWAANRPADAPPVTGENYTFLVHPTTACPQCNRHSFLRTRDGHFETCRYCNNWEYTRRVDEQTRLAWLEELRKARAEERRKKAEEAEKKAAHEKWKRTPEGKAETARIKYNTCKQCKGIFDEWFPSLNGQFELCPSCRSPRVKKTTKES